MNKVFITGCGGMLGSAVYPFFKEKGYDVLATDIDLNEDWLEYLDVRDYKQAKDITDKFQPDIILHLGALTSLEYCENHLEEAYKTNFTGTKNIAQICREQDIPLVYISTAGVFDGKKEVYNEDDTPNPINVYGKTKLYAEIAVENLLERYFIVRAGWMVGGGKKDKKFVSYIVSQARAGNRIFNIVDDKFGVPTYTEDFSKNLNVLINTDFYGLYHMACSGNASRLEIAEHVLNKLGVKGYKINPVSSEFFKEDFPVQRATSEIMVNCNLSKRDINHMRDWRICLSEYLEKESQK